MIGRRGQGKRADDPVADRRCDVSVALAIPRPDLARRGPARGIRHQPGSKMQNDRLRTRRRLDERGNGCWRKSAHRRAARQTGTIYRWKLTFLTASTSGSSQAEIQATTSLARINPIRLRSRRFALSNRFAAESYRASSFAAVSKRVWPGTGIMYRPTARITVAIRMGGHLPAGPLSSFAAAICRFALCCRF